MKDRLCSMQSFRRGDWHIKASILDDQILIFLINDNTMEHRTEMFYDEEAAYLFIESLYDRSY